MQRRCVAAASNFHKADALLLVLSLSQTNKAINETTYRQQLPHERLSRSTKRRVCEQKETKQNHPRETTAFGCLNRGTFDSVGSGRGRNSFILTSECVRMDWWQQQEKETMRVVAALRLCKVLVICSVHSLVASIYQHFFNVNISGLFECSHPVLKTCLTP